MSKSLQEEKPDWETQVVQAIENELDDHQDCDNGCIASSETLLEPIRKIVQEQISLAVQKERERVTSIIQNLNAFVPNTGSDQEQKMREIFKSIINLVNPNNL